MSVPTSVAITKIAETGGDLILEVGDPKDTRKLLVSSVILKQVSSVFTALLGPNFREGHAAVRSEETPQTIEFKEDDATAMQDMCSLLHMKVVPDLMKAVPDPLRVLHLAVVVDKYGCTEVLSLQLMGLLSASSARPSTAENTQIIAAATYVFGHGRMFREVTKHWTMEGYSIKPVRELEVGDLSQILPWRVFGKSHLRMWSNPI